MTMEDELMIAIAETTLPTVAMVPAERVVEGTPETRT